MIAQLEKGAFGAIRHALGAVLRGALIGLIVGVVIGEVLGAVMDSGATAASAWPHSVFFHVSAVLLGLALAYAIAITTALTETVKGVLRAARDVESDARQATNSGFGDLGRVVDSIERKL